ncbi:hypothetical protein BDW22DRAFT_162004 [Trametopsis cervina]|nr:hypothetical protein BDW22DRAFT_162004 [Trametopsis cervina]
MSRVTTHQSIAASNVVMLVLRLRSGGCWHESSTWVPVFGTLKASHIPRCKPCTFPSALLSFGFAYSVSLLFFLTFQEPASPFHILLFLRPSFFLSHPCSAVYFFLHIFKMISTRVLLLSLLFGSAAFAAPMGSPFKNSKEVVKMSAKNSSSQAIAGAAYC